MGFPEELKKLNRWVGYRLVPDKDGGKPKKVPINAVTGQNAKSNDPATWCDYQTAKEAADQYGYIDVYDDGSTSINTAMTIAHTLITSAGTAGFKVENEPGAALPNTGGPGTTVFYLLGIVLTVFAGAGLVMKRKRKAS